ncbi:uncharacterized protein LOC112090950 [Morus notabilis]|uniref:uncharacterized protein LOC112090950 n=1 Tax=Morus notabilis TaxID=981085 RepID=UPI000CED070C|nr:uncharacterized protein LOC112090950 [Morus notabilis]
MPPTEYLPVYTRAVTAGMTLPVHPFVKDYCHFYGISPAQLAPNFCQQSGLSQQPPLNQQPPPSQQPPSKGKEKASSSSHVPRSKKTKGPSGSKMDPTRKKRRKEKMPMSLLDDAVEKRDVAVAKLASLEDELAKLKAEVKNLTKRVDLSDKKLSEAAGEAKKRFAEGKTKGKREAEVEATATFDARRAEIIEEFKASQELTDIHTKDFQSAG